MCFVCLVFLACVYLVGCVVCSKEGRKEREAQGRLGSFECGFRKEAKLKRDLEVLSVGLGKKGKLKGDLEVLSVGLGKWRVRSCTMAESLLTPSHGDSGWGVECSSPPCWAPTCYPSSPRSRSLHCCEMVMLLLLLLHFILFCKSIQLLLLHSNRLLFVF